MPTQYPGVRKSGKDTYAYRFRRPADPLTGKRSWVVRGGYASAYAASRARTDHMARLYAGGGETSPEDRTVTQAVEDWIASKRRARPATTGNRRQRLRLYIAPYIGDVRLRDVKRRTIIDWLDALERYPIMTGGRAPRLLRTGLAARTIEEIVSIVSAAFTQEVRDGTMTTNPILDVDTPRPVKRRPLVWDDDEIRRVAPMLETSPYAAMWLLMLLAQLRPGEIIGLEWADIQLDTAALDIQRTRTLTEDLRVIVGTTTKTLAGVREAALSDSCVAALRALRDEHERAWQLDPDWNPHRRVFPGRGDKPMSLSTISDRLDRICADAQVTRLTPHGLRHTGATWLDRIGVSAAIISQRLGHTSVKFTLDNYVHHGRAEQQDASDRLDSLLGRHLRAIVTSDVTYTDVVGGKPQSSRASG